MCETVQTNFLAPSHSQSDTGNVFFSSLWAMKCGLPIKFVMPWDNRNAEALDVLFKSFLYEAISCPRYTFAWCFLNHATALGSKLSMQYTPL